MNPKHYLLSQQGGLTEELKKTLLAEIPIVFIITDQLGLVHEVIYKSHRLIAPVSRKPMKVDKINTSQNGTSVVLMSADKTKKPQNLFAKIPIEVNEDTGEVKTDIEVPSLFLQFLPAGAQDAGNPNTKIWQDIYKGLQNLTRVSSGFSNEDMDSLTVSALRHSMAIIVTPQIPSIPADLKPYSKVIWLEAMKEDEITDLIAQLIKKHDDKEIDRTGKEMNFLVRQLKGLSVIKIEQIFRRLKLEIGQTTRKNLIEEYKKEFEKIITDEKAALIRTSPILEYVKLGKKQEAAGMKRFDNWLTEVKPLILNYEQALTEARISAPKGVLLSGIPGSGKSLMSKTIARSLGLPLIQLDMGKLQSKYVGESEHNLEEALHLVEAMSPCVLWIDEIEKNFAGVSGGAGDGGVTKRMFGKFLTWMQEKDEHGVCCFIVATSNDVSSLPPELFRNGRFDRKYFSYMPSAEECQAIFNGIVCGQEAAYAKDHATGHLFAEEILKKEYFAPFLDNLILERYDKDSGHIKPNNKFVTGADIEAIIEGAKRRIYHSGTKSTVVFTRNAFNEALKETISETRTYGETNLLDMVKCFVQLCKDNFSCVGEKEVIPFSNVDLFTDKEDEHFCWNANYLSSLCKYDEQLYTCTGLVITKRWKDVCPR